MKSLLKLLMLLSISGITFSAFGTVRYHCAQDSATVMQIIEHAAAGANLGERVAGAAKAMQGIPLGRAADNDMAGTIVVRLDSLSQREFIHMALAAAKTAALTVPTLRDFEKNLENISRLKGVDTGFTSQFFYASDWIIDNIYRGNLKEMTEYLDGGSYRTKTLDYVSRHPEEFPAMADSTTAAKMRIVEFGFRGHRIPHLKKQSISNKAVKELLRDGDIIILSPPDPDFDIYDIGIVSLDKGEPYLIHISRDGNVVTLDPYPLSRLFKIEGQFFYGYRWLRPVE